MKTTCTAMMGLRGLRRTGLVMTVLAAVLMLPDAAGQARAQDAQVAAQGEQPGSGDRAAFASACKTYENRARFLPRGDGADFLVRLADGCRPALEALERGGPGKAAARTFLTRVLLLRDTIVQMGLDGIYGRGADPRAHPIQTGGLLRPLGGVSRTGEYLIAHRMGVFAAHDIWRGHDSAGPALDRTRGEPERSGGITTPGGG